MREAGELDGAAQADEVIIGRVRSGETEAFAQLVSRYQRQVLALGFRFFRSREDAEDFVQDVFLQAFRKLNTFRSTGRFYSWLMRIAYNRGCRLINRLPSFDSLGDAQLAYRGPGPHDTLEHQEARRTVVEAIRELPAKYADCIGLYFFFDLSYQEISDVTRNPLNTVRSHIRRAKLMLARRLSDVAGDDSGGRDQ